MPTGEVGDVIGVVDAIVLPMPVRKLGETILRLPVIEQELRGTIAVDVVRAGLWGEPMAMTNGILEFDAVLGLRDSDAMPGLIEP